MNFLFPVSGVETPLWLPPAVALGISFFASMGGVTGAFLILPFQVSVLGYNTPSVSATNHIYNIVAIPSGVYRYIRERRMVWPLAWVVILGTLPGVFVGAWIRIAYLPDPRHFKLFAGCVLGYLGVRLLRDLLSGHKKKGDPGEEGAAQDGTTQEGAPQDGVARDGAAQKQKGHFMVEGARFTLRTVSYTFEGTTYSVPTPVIFLISLVVGVVGGIYGIGGGAFMAPVFVAVYQLPVFTIAGATLLGTLLTSASAVVFFHLLAVLQPELAVQPDWALGALFGLGGVLGMYLGARLQKHMPARFVKVVLCVAVLFITFRYITAFF